MLKYIVYTHIYKKKEESSNETFLYNDRESGLKKKKIKKLNYNKSNNNKITFRTWDGRDHVIN